MKAIILKAVFAILFFLSVVVSASAECNKDNYMDYIMTSGDHKCKLNSVRFFRMGLRGANFRGANLNVTKFEGGSLEGADLTDAGLFRASFNDVNLRYANLRNVRNGAMSVQSSSLVGAKLIGGNFQNSKWRDVNLENANMSNAAFSNADFRKVNLVGARVTGANFANARFSGSDLMNVDFKGAMLAGADLRGADITGAKFEGANLEGVKVTPEQAEYLGSLNKAEEGACAYKNESGPIHIKTKRCGDFCSGEILCDRHDFRVSVDVLCLPEGNYCPSAEQCMKQKKPNTVSSVRRDADFQSEYSKSDFNQIYREKYGREQEEKSDSNAVQ